VVSSQETGNRKQEAGSRKQEAGNRKQEAGNRKQESSIIFSLKQTLNDRGFHLTLYSFYL